MVVRYLRIRSTASTRLVPPAFLAEARAGRQTFSVVLVLLLVLDHRCLQYGYGYARLASSFDLDDYQLSHSISQSRPSPHEICLLGTFIYTVLPCSRDFVSLLLTVVSSLIGDTGACVQETTLNSMTSDSVLCSTILSLPSAYDALNPLSVSEAMSMLTHCQCHWTGSPAPVHCCPK